jgi:hypothetical protein
MFNPAYTEIHGVLNGNYHQRFLAVARTIAEDLRAADEHEEDAEDDGPHEISAPAATKMTRDQIDRSTVDGWNQSARKELSEGDGTPVYELDDLVVIEHPALPTMDQALVGWIRAEDGVHTTGLVTMTAKDGAFSAGTFTVDSLQNQGAVKTAIARVSKKKVVFE